MIEALELQRKPLVVLSFERVQVETRSLREVRWIQKQEYSLICNSSNELDSIKSRYRDPVAECKELLQSVAQ